MEDSIFQTLPPKLKVIERDTKKSSFSMSSEQKTGSFLRTLASSKPGGKLLELGTGTGLSAAWILSGMNSKATLHSVDNDEKVLGIARKHLEDDTRIIFHHTDSESFIRQASPNSIDLIFADAWPGKYNLLDETLALLKMGGFYVIDDMSPQPNWPGGHAEKAIKLLKILDQKDNLSVCRLDWATGIVICTRTS